MKNRILVVDDEVPLLDAFSRALHKDGFDVSVASNAKGGLEIFTREGADLVITDLVMPEMNGLDLLDRIRALPGEYIPVILITGYCGEVVELAEALRRGADDFIQKPVLMDELCQRVHARLRVREIYREMARISRDRDEAIDQNRRLSSQLARRSESAEPIRTPALVGLFDLLDSLRGSDVSVLLTGETGTGKGVFARYLHDSGPRHEHPFAVLHCASIPSTLLSSELFGYERGAFTGADRQRVGRLESAAGGTLFLDEIGEISPEVQVALLRFLQDGEFERLGSSRTIRSEVRIVAASNRDLPAAVAAGQFRADLYYRLNVVGIEVPPLRKRREDVPILAQHLLARKAQRLAKPVTAIDPSALNLLMRHSWPGNVREMENVIERAMVLARGVRLTAADIHFGGNVLTSPPVEAPEAQRSEESCPVCAAGQSPLDACLSAVERQHIEKALQRAGGNHSEAARLLGIPRTTLLGKMSTHGLGGTGGPKPEPSVNSQATAAAATAPPRLSAEESPRLDATGPRIESPSDSPPGSRRSGGR